MKSLLFEKLPFFSVAGAFAVITVISTSRNALLTTPDNVETLKTPLKVCYLLAFYLGKIVWPANLSPVYVMPEPMSLAQPVLLGTLLGTGVMFAILAMSLRWTRALASGWLFFVVGVSPTLGVIGYSWVSASDKYVYFPAIGLLITLTWLLIRIGGGTDHGAARRRAAISVPILLMATAEVQATRRCLLHWQDTEQHYRHVVRLAPNSPAARHNLGYALGRLKKTDEAIGELEETLRLSPGLATAHNNLGVALADARRFDEAVHHFEEALRSQPRFASAHRNLADVLLRGGDAETAAKHYAEAVAVNPDLVPAINNLAWIHATRLDARPEDVAEAIRLAEHACALTRHRQSDALDTLAAAYAAAGRFDDAISTAKRAIALAEKTGPRAQTAGLGARLRLYEERRPYREAPRSSAPATTSRPVAS